MELNFQAIVFWVGLVVIAVGFWLWLNTRWGKKWLENL